MKQSELKRMFGNDAGDKILWPHLLTVACSPPLNMFPVGVKLGVKFTAVNSVKFEDTLQLYSAP